MKSILQSIKPQYCELIASGKKTIEVRKTRPKCELPVKVYIYCTKDKEIFYQSRYRKDFIVYKPKFYNDTEILLQQNGHTVFNGKVIGEYVCDEITGGYLMEPFGDFLQKQTCLTYDELKKYANDKPLYFWHLTDLKIYDKPKELGEFYKSCGTQNCRGCQFWFNNGEYAACETRPMRQLKRPPRSWCYVEEVS